MISSGPELTPLSIFKIFSKQFTSIKKCFKEKVYYRIVSAVFLGKVKDLTRNYVQINSYT